MYAKPIFDEKTHFAKSIDDLYVVWPMRGDGVFGSWSLAKVIWQKNRAQSIIIDRAMTPSEISLFHSHPINFRGVLYESASRNNGNCAAAFICFRWSKFGPPGGGPSMSGHKVFV